MKRLIFKSFRCFVEEHSISVKPLTLLVGENSTGKSTFLALSRLLWDVTRGRRNIDFNEEPFPLGSFDQIATLRSGRHGRAKTFEIGAEFDVTIPTSRDPAGAAPRQAPATVIGTFQKAGVQPGLCAWCLRYGDNLVEISWNDAGEPTISMSLPSGRIVITDFPLHPSDRFVPEAFSLIRWMMSEKKPPKSWFHVQGEMPSKRDVATITDVARVLTHEGPRPYAFAPIRTKPIRTYDPFREEPRPEGTHMPMTLARLEASHSVMWSEVRDSLDEFGRSSGLFRSIKVRRLGPKKRESDPFQLQIAITGPPFNLVDVGYGVSQVLPLVVDILTARGQAEFLLQQPEVHLHPKAQAAFASLLSQIAKAQGKSFVVETHSDYIVDRIRMDVRDRRGLHYSDIAILYFERESTGVRIHELSLDEMGNFVEIPPSYRSFFLDEERRLLGV